MQLDSEGKRRWWIVEMLEYDLKIKPTKLVKEKGLDKILTERNWKSLGINDILNNSAFDDEIPNEERDLHVHEKFLSSPWYKDIVYFLQTMQCPLDMEK